MPHSELKGERPALRIMREGELWPDEAPARAGVSAFGFGGINTHVTLEAADHSRRKSFTGFEQQRLSAAQDCELFLLQASDLNELAAQLDEILSLANEISYAEMTDLAAHLANKLDGASQASASSMRCIDSPGTGASCQGIALIVVHLAAPRE